MEEKAKNPDQLGRPDVTRESIHARVSAEITREYQHGAELSDASEPPQTSSAREKAKQLPYKMWIIVAAGLIAWTIVAIGALLFFG